MQQSRNIAARAGRWSARHRKTAILGWIDVRGPGLHGRRQARHRDAHAGAVGRRRSGQRRQDRRRTPTPTSIGESVLIQSKSLKTDDPEFRAVVADVTEAPRGHEGRERDHTAPTARASSAARSPTTAIPRWSASRSPGDTKDAAAMKIVDDTVAEVEAAQKAHPDFNVEQFGVGQLRGSSSRRSSTRTSQKATFGSLPITLILLVIAFGTLVAAGIPLLLAITGVVATMGLVGPLSQLSPVEESINHVILLIGLAVGVDYALFYLRRVREERAAGTEQGSSHRGGRGDLGPRGARLRHHGDDRDGRDVLRRSRDVHLVRHRHHRGRRRRDARIAHRAPGRAVDARRPHREGPGSRPRPSPQPRGPRSASGRASWTGCCGARCCRPCLATGLLVALAIPAHRHGHRHPEHLGLAAAGRAGRPDVQPGPGGVPVRDLVAERGHQGQGRDGPRRHRRAGEARAGRRASTRRCSRRTDARARREPRQDRRRRSRSRSPATGPTRSRAGRSTCSGTKWCRPRIGSVDGVEAYVGGDTAHGCATSTTR